MGASIVLAYATVALSGNELGLIGAVIGGVSTIIAALMTISAASRQQKRELRYQRKGSGMTGFLLALLLVSIAAIVYFASRPNPEARADDAAETSAAATTAPRALPAVESTTLAAVEAPIPTDTPITLEEASAFVLSYLETADNEATEDQVWAMFTDAYKADPNRSPNGESGLAKFWQGIDTVTLTGSPSLTSDSTPSRAVVTMPLTYYKKSGKCVVEKDDFTVVRIDGAPKIDNRQLASTGNCP